MKHLLSLCLIIVSSLYILDADEKSKSLVVIEYSDNNKDIVVIPRAKAKDDTYIFNAIKPILTKRGVL